MTRSGDERSYLHKLVSICKALDMTLVALLCYEENAEQTAHIDYVTDENYIIEFYRRSDTESRRRMISYLALLDVCKQINDSAQSKKQQRNVFVIQDIDGKMYLYDILDIKKETSTPLEP